MSRFRWRGGVLSLDNTVVGTVDQGAGGDWFAYGCMDDWQDTPLGSLPNEEIAKLVVLEWAENHL